MRPIKDDYNLDLIPKENRFGYKRKFDYHTGVDLFCDNNELVYSMYSGHVTSIHEFTGFKESPWWNDTYAIMVYHPEIDKTFLYGELIPSVNINDNILAGQLIGYVKQVLKRDKGRPMSMLHIECYTGLQNESVWWRHGENMPENLEDITPFLY